MMQRALQHQHTLHAVSSKAQSAGDAASWSRHTQHEAQTQGSLIVMSKMLQSHVAVRQQEQEQH